LLNPEYRQKIRTEGIILLYGIHHFYSEQTEDWKNGKKYLIMDENLIEWKKKGNEYFRVLNWGGV
jgi:hypothetical protein